MASRGGARPQYSDESRRRLIGEIEAQFKAGKGSIAEIAARLGTCEASYHNWVKAGFVPSRAVVPMYSSGRRAELLAAGQELMTKGLSAGAAARELGVAGDTLRRWLRAEGVEAVSFRPVVVTEIGLSASTGPAASGLTLISPGGYRVEGLAVDTAAQLLRALA